MWVFFLVARTAPPSLTMVPELIFVTNITNYICGEKNDNYEVCTHPLLSAVLVLLAAAAGLLHVDNSLDRAAGRGDLGVRAALVRICTQSGWKHRKNL